MASPAQLMPGRTFTSTWHQGTFGTFSNSPQYEYLISLWELDDGQQMLCDFLNRQLRADEFPSALREAQVALIPAIIAITGHGGHRPRHLLECLNKVYSVGFYITIPALQPRGMRHKCNWGA